MVKSLTACQGLGGMASPGEAIHFDPLTDPQLDSYFAAAGNMTTLDVVLTRLLLCAQLSDLAVFDPLQRIAWRQKTKQQISLRPKSLRLNQRAA